MSNKRLFWRIVALIGVVHAIAIIGLIRWNSRASQTSNQSIVWVNSDSEGGAHSSLAKHQAVAESKTFTTEAVEPAPTPSESPDEEQPVLTSARSEIELPAPTLAPTPETKPSPTPVFKNPPKPTPQPPRHPRPKPTIKPKPTATAKPKPKKTLLAKVFSRSTPKAKPSPESEENTDTESADNEASKKDSSLETADSEASNTAVKSDRNETGEGSGGVGQGRGMGKNSEFASYGRMLHDRFYSGWSQPTTTVASAAKMSTVVRVRIEKDGRVSTFEIVRPSGNVMVDESVAAIGKEVTHVDPPPAGLRKGGHYDVKINFELNSD